jgi:hypothetical protein
VKQQTYVKDTQAVGIITTDSRGAELMARWIKCLASHEGSRCIDIRIDDEGWLDLDVTLGRYCRKWYLACQNHTLGHQIRQAQKKINQDEFV